VTETACWGYCRKNGEVIINWQLAYLPIRLAEFVILHELVHLQVLNHQREFHSKMLKLMPDYLMRESELRYYQTIEPEALNNIRRNRTVRALTKLKRRRYEYYRKTNDSLCVYSTES
jgi:hypothetical protein